MPTLTHRPTLVVGATGKTGRRVLDRLTALDVPVRAGSRAGRPPFDWEDPATWTPALAGMGAAYISYYPDIAVPGAPQVIADFADAALAAGTRRLVLLSGRGEEEAQRAEEALRASGADWTVVRCSWFCQNFSESFFLDPIMAGELALPVDGMPEPFVDVEDVADVAAAALTDDRHVGEVYELTGARLLTFAEAVGEIAAAVDREIRFVPVGIDDFTAAMDEQQVPGDVIALMRYLFTEVLDGRNAHLADGVHRALGRPARDFRAFVERAAQAGSWGPPATR